MSGAEPTWPWRGMNEFNASAHEVLTILTLMPLDSRAGQMFAVFGRFGREGANPAEWDGRIHELLGEAFELETERRESPPHAHRPQASWEENLRTSAPLREVVARLDEEGTAALRVELESVQERYRDRPPSYVVVLGRHR